MNPRLNPQHPINDDLPDLTEEAGLDLIDDLDDLIAQADDDLDAHGC